MITYHQTDLTSVLQNKQFQVFAHGCNCFWTMGKGIAKIVKELFPEAYEADTKTKYASVEKLGKIGIVPIESDKYVINAYTQFDFRGSQKNVNYSAIEHCFQKIHCFMKERNLQDLIIPKIGAGLARGDWEVIEKIILSTCEDLNIHVYYK